MEEEKEELVEREEDEESDIIGADETESVGRE